MIDIDRAVKQYQLAIDSLINSVGRTITLVFTEQVTHVSAELTDYVRPGEIRKPSYKLSNTVQPAVTTTTQSIKALIKWNPSDYQKFDLRKDGPDTLLRLKTFLTDLPALQRCSYIVLKSSSASMQDTRFKMIYQPQPRGLREDRYAYSFWELV